MWGDRHDRVLGLDELVRDGLTPPPPPPPLDGGPDGEPAGDYPTTGLAALELCGKTYITVWGRQHVVQPEALARLLSRAQLPFDPADPVRAAWPAAASHGGAGSGSGSGTTGAGGPGARENRGDDGIRFF